MGLLDKIKASVAGAGIKTTGAIFKDLADGIAQFVNTPGDKEKALEFIKTKEAEAQVESNRHDEVVAGAAQKELDSQLADMNSARNMQIAALNQDDKFAKRFIYYLAALVITIVVAFDFCLFFIKYPPENKEMINMIAGILNSTALVMVLGFFFGSSKGSGDKSVAMDKMMDKISSQS